MNISQSYDPLYTARPDHILWGNKPGRLVQVLPLLLRPGATILDAGCGDGKNALYLEALGNRVVGFDQSSFAIEGLANRFRLAGREPQGRYETLDVATYLESHPEETVDALVSYGLFHALPLFDRLELHRKLQEHVKQGGYLFFASLTADLPLPPHHGSREMILAQRGEIGNLFRGYTVGYWKRGTITEAHEPVVGMHEHSVMWVIAQRNEER